MFHAMRNQPIGEQPHAKGCAKRFTPGYHPVPIRAKEGE